MESQKLKVMLQAKDGFVMSKCQMITTDGNIIWQFAKSPGKNMFIAAQTFEDHGYDVVTWDDEQESSDGTVTFKLDDERFNKGS